MAKSTKQGWMQCLSCRKWVRDYQTRISYCARCATELRKAADAKARASSSPDLHISITEAKE